MDPQGEKTISSRETYPMRQKRLQPHKYTTFGIPMNDLYVSPFGWNLRHFFMVKQLKELPNGFIELLHIDYDNEFRTIEFDSPTSDTDPSILSSICSFFKFIQLDGIGGIPLHGPIIKTLVVIHSERLGKYSNKIRNRHETRIAESGLNEEDLSVFVNYCNFNCLIIDLKRKKKKIRITSSMDGNQWVILLTSKEGYEILTQKQMSPERCKVVFSDDEVISLLFDIDDTAMIENYESIGNVNPGLSMRHYIEEDFSYESD